MEMSYYPTLNDSMNFSVLNLSSRVSQLETASEFNYEFRDTYYVNISIDDGLNTKYYELFELSITDINDNPTDIMIENLSFEENNIENELLSLISVIDQDFEENLTTSTVGFDSNLSMYYVLVPTDSFSIFAVYDEDKLITTTPTTTTSSSGGGRGSSSTSTVEINLDIIENDETFTLSIRDEVILNLNNTEIGTIEIIQINFNGDIELEVDSNTIIVSQGDRIFVRGLLGSGYELTIIQSNSIRSSLQLQITNKQNNNVIDSVIENSNLSVDETRVDNSVSGQFTSDYTDSIIVILLSILIIGGIIFIALKK